ncbi:hypothetical protein [Candidatus Jidaibacter acanthamoebae]|uniref:hypothetical protein n=1 Tax=Candidatus Jidaibacter acanthamoebae TaxID=86105 RepID=UPI00057E1C27|nr:hypothetical protein [Candidatus Jidaibacter acanthamoeba]
MEELAVIEYWSSVKEIIDRVCEEYNALWQKRSRILNSKIIVIMIFKNLKWPRSRPQYKLVRVLG